MEPLDSSHLLLRGCTLRKTEWVIGAVVFTGERVGGGAGGGQAEIGLVDVAAAPGGAAAAAAAACGGCMVPSSISQLVQR
jgi:hypothetical protein